MVFVCTDIDECERGVSECDQGCHNNDGSYMCSCDDGFKLNNDGLYCDGNQVLIALNST